MRRKTTREQCIIKQCLGFASSRGLCPTCYNLARKMIKDGQTTEKELMQKGMMLESNKQKISPFRAQFQLPAQPVFKNQFFGR